MRDREVGGDAHRGAALGRDRAQESQPRRRRGEQLAHLHACPRTARGGGATQDLAVADVQGRTARSRSASGCVRRSSDTAAMLASASPRKPSVRTRAMSSATAIFDVA